MTFGKYIWRSLFHYRKQHLALLAATLLSAAVLTGALIIGDSVSYSLHSLVETRLGQTGFTITGGSRFVRSKLAGELSASLKIPAAPLLLLQGMVIHTENGNRINKAKIIGIDSSFSLLAREKLPVLKNDEAIINENIAGKLKLKINDELLVRVESSGLIPVNSPLSQEPKASVALRLTVKAIASEAQLGMFNLNNDQSSPSNVFVSQDFLGQKLDLTHLANVLLIAGDPDKGYTRDTLRKTLQSLWKIEDMGLKLENRDSFTYDITSNRVFIDDALSKLIVQSGVPHQDVITYLVNSIRFKNKQTPYSFATASSPSLTRDSLRANEVIVNRWLQTDLDLATGDSIDIRYYEISPLRDLRETSKRFAVKKIIETQSPGIDNSLMPSFQGLSDAGHCRDWNAGVPIDLKLIRDKDEKYWDDYRGTPKVLLPLETGKKLWHNSFGTLTAIRFNKNQLSQEKLKSLLTSNISPEQIGLNVIATRNEGTSAASNAVNFSELFVSLSFFIIVAGILLIVLMFSLHMESRSSEIATLSGLGISRKTILHLKITETAVVIGIGSVIGAALGIVYNYGLLAGLNSVWNDAVRTQMLNIYVKPGTLLTGALSTIVIALLPVYWITRRKLGKPVARLIKGGKTLPKAQDKKHYTGKILGYAALTGAFIMAGVAIATSSLENATLYLSASALFLTGSISVFYFSIIKGAPSVQYAIPSLSGLALKNLKRNKNRSIAVISLLAVGTFTILLTGAYRKTFYGTENSRSSGTGGNLLWTETTTPVPFNLNSPEGKDYLKTTSDKDLDSVHFLQFQKLEGDDASCLNLNQAQRPSLLGVNPALFDSKHAFSFTGLLPSISKEHPWKELEKRYTDSVFPAFADQTVIQYGLKKKIGDTLVYINEKGRKCRLVLAGGLNNSIFQGYLLISEETFRDQFPSAGGSKVILTDAPAAKQKLISDILDQSLIDYGAEVTSTSQRLATFNSVENTYLSVFMALSGLGLLIGTIGLGIVLLRNINERKQELALLLSLGYTRKLLFRMVYLENLILLSAGIIIGFISAIVGILPSLLSPSFNIEGGFLVVILALIVVSGTLWIYFPLKIVLKKALIPSLRSE